ncbi:hypothetical protein CEP54_002622 [Fusarium duplospermum]|uniref:Uncharacterized protein n=1 Tax=Fusarium duplospermum TaxID=1325734 RepID=A0A428QTJ4_9HYPO|nr:hypothetical protein CEP54_002622 [Fusarium duplospermum]
MDAQGGSRAAQRSSAQYSTAQHSTGARQVLTLQSRVSLFSPGTPLNKAHYSGPDLSRRALASLLNRCFSLGAGP